MDMSVISSVSKHDRVRLVMDNAQSRRIALTGATPRLAARESLISLVEPNLVRCTSSEYDQDRSVSSVIPHAIHDEVQL